MGMKRWILSLLVLISATLLQSCGPLEGGGDPLDGAGPSRVGSAYPGSNTAQGTRAYGGMDAAVDF
jgi:predicted small secreted protein